MIKNGFIRTEFGPWINLLELRNLYISEENFGFPIFAKGNNKDEEGDLGTYVINADFKTRKEANDDGSINRIRDR